MPQSLPTGIARDKISCVEQWAGCRPGSLSGADAPAPLDDVLELHRVVDNGRYYHAWLRSNAAVTAGLNMVWTFMGGCLTAAGLAPVGVTCAFAAVTVSVCALTGKQIRGLNEAEASMTDHIERFTATLPRHVLK